MDNKTVSESWCLIISAWVYNALLKEPKAKRKADMTLWYKSTPTLSKLEYL